MDVDGETPGRTWGQKLQCTAFVSRPLPVGLMTTEEVRKHSRVPLPRASPSQLVQVRSCFHHFTPLCAESAEVYGQIEHSGTSVQMYRMLDSIPRPRQLLPPLYSHRDRLWQLGRCWPALTQKHRRIMGPNCTRITCQERTARMTYVRYHTPYQPQTPPLRRESFQSSSLTISNFRVVHITTVSKL